MPSAHPLFDHDDIRAWAEARRAKPSCVRRTGGKNDPGMIRLDFPGYSGRQSLAPISWEQWFKAFDANQLALLVQDETARGQRSNFNKLVSRESLTDGAAPRRQRKRPAGTSREGASSARSSRAASRTGSMRTRRTASSGRSKTARAAQANDRGGARRRKSASTASKSTTRKTGNRKRGATGSKKR